MAKQITEIIKQETSTQQPIKTTLNPSSTSSEGFPPLKGVVADRGMFDYEHALAFLQTQGIKHFGSHFKIHEADKPLLHKLLCYFLQDADTASQLGIKLNKGILLTGPVGCGKTSLMFLLRLYLPFENRYTVKSCRDISFEFIKDGYPIISKYSHQSFRNNQPLAYCFDDLGTENNLKHFGNECNIMAEILLSRYDLFVSRQLLTHVTTNLSASEIETLYGNRVRSRMRELFNLIAFDKEAKDKRK